MGSMRATRLLIGVLRFCVRCVLVASSLSRQGFLTMFVSETVSMELEGLARGLFFSCNLLA
jgi:hypothetical protein